MATLTESVSSSLSWTSNGSGTKSTEPLQVRVATRNRALESAIYRTKMSRPTRVLWHRITHDYVDIETGAKIVELDSIAVSRAVFLPVATESNFVMDLAYLAASRDFTVGGLWDKSLSRILIDTNDIPVTWGPPTAEDFFIIGDHRFQPKKVTNYDDRVFDIAVTETVGEVLIRIETTGSALSLEQTNAGTL